MAIKIAVKDANKDGKGINFGAYLASFDKTYLRDGYGSFNSTDPMAMSGTQYASTNVKDFGAVLTSGKAKWEYDLATHKITGSLNAVTFGNKVELVGSRFKSVSDIDITGLNVTDKTLAGKILSDIMGGKNTDGGATTSLQKLLKANAIEFSGSTGNDTFTGFGKADKISGNNGNDTLKGGGGNDTISGGAGNDKLYGDAGNDKLSGGTGNDTLDGGAGNDKLTGGSGNDVFIFKKGQGNDTITDFQAGSAKGDVIRLDKSVLKNFNDVLSHATEKSGDLIIDYGKNTIKLEGIDKADLHANDFFFF